MSICFVEQDRAAINSDVLIWGDFMKFFTIGNLIVAVERILQAK